MNISKTLRRLGMGLVCRRCFLGSRRTITILKSPGVDQLRKRLDQYAEEEHEKQHELPAEIEEKLKAVPDSKRFEHIIDNRLLNIDDLIRYYDTLDGITDENQVVMFASELYKQNKYQKACQVMIDNLPFGTGFINAFVNKLIPGLEDHDGRDIALGNLVYEMCRIGHGSLARQVVQEMGLSTDIVNDAGLVLDGIYSGLKGKELASFICQSKGIKFPNFSQLPLWTQVVLLLCNYTRVFKKEELKKEVVQMLNQPWVLRAMFKAASPAMIPYIRQFIERTDVTIPTEALVMLPTLDSEGSTRLQQLWKIYRVYAKRNGYNEHVIDAFIQHSITKRETITLLHAVRKGLDLGCVKSDTVSIALAMLTYGKKRSSTHRDDFELYHDNKDVDTKSLTALINSTPENIIKPALYSIASRLGTRRKANPGRILWNILLSLEESQTLQALPYRVELQFARAMALRPHFEQMRYMALSVVSMRGIMLLLQEFISQLNQRGHEQRLSNNSQDADSKLVIAGLTIMQEKSSPGATGRDPLSRAIIDLFQRWDDSKVLQIVEQLDSESAIVQALASLVDRNEHTLAIKLINQHQSIKPSTFYEFLVKCSQLQPRMCFKLLLWLDSRQFKVPVPVLRRMVVNFARAAQLSDTASVRYITKVRQLLKAQRAPLGTYETMEFVESVIVRAERSGWGSRDRLEYVLRVARQDPKIDPEVWKKWATRLNQMKLNKRGYWSSNAYRRLIMY